MSMDEQEVLSENRIDYVIRCFYANAFTLDENDDKKNNTQVKYQNESRKIFN